MKKLLGVAALIIALGTWSDAGFPLVIGGISISHMATSPPTNSGWSALPQISGQDFPAAGTTVSFSTDVGTWSNSPTSYSCNWHYVGGGSLGSNCNSLTLDTLNPGVVDSALIVDVTATNSAGSATASSHWIGPIETAAPAAQPAWETCFNGNFTAGSFVNGTKYTIVSVGTTDFTLIGASSNTPGVSFTATGVGAGTGIAGQSTCAAGATPNDLPISPARFLQNEHAVYPGCVIPPASPNLASGHVWYVDPINGATQTAGATGSHASPFKDASAILGPTQGYPGAAHVSSVSAPSGGSVTITGTGFGTFLGKVYIGGFGPAALNTWHDTSTSVIIPIGAPTPTVGNVEVDTQLTGQLNSLIPAGDTIYLEPGNVSHPVGDIAGQGYSTNDGTGTGTINFTWIMGDPAAGSVPVAHSVNVGSGSGGIVGYIFKNFNIEEHRDLNAAGNAALIPFNVGFSAVSAPSGYSHDDFVEGLSISQWLGHSTDPRTNSPYPNTNGYSDGTVVTASPTFSSSADSLIGLTVRADNASTTVFTNTVGVLGQYIFSPNLYFNGPTKAPSTGIPTGSIVTAINGLNAANYNNLGVVNGFQPSDFPSISGFTLNGVVTTAPTGTPTAGTYWILRPNNTTAQTLYIPNAGNTAWVSGGIFLPFLPTASPAPSYTGLFNEPGMPLGTFIERLAHWNGSSWDDLGPLSVTIAACDPVNDAGTGCPTSDYVNPANGLSRLGTNVPGCNPFVTFEGGTTSGNCPGGTPPAYGGTTRALGGGSSGAGEATVAQTQGLTIVPSGYWNFNDWDGGLTALIRVDGSLNTAGSIDPSRPNLYQGVSCISMKDNLLRNTNGGIGIFNLTNSIAYNNIEKWVSNDANEVYSSHRIWMIHNLYSDPTLAEGHRDFIQGGDVNGFGESPAGTFIEYSDAFLENEAYQSTDLTNYFPGEMQCINNTEHTYWAVYNALNICGSTESNGINMGGKWNVLAHNMSFTTGGSLGIQNKGSTGVPATSAPSTIGPLYGLLANNVGASWSQLISLHIPPGITNWCDPVLGDLVTAEGNVALPSFASGGGISSNSYAMCNITTNTTNGSASSGAYVGENGWTAIDWRSGQGGVTPLLKAFNPLGPAVAPNPGWQSIGIPLLMTNTCTQGSFQATTCPTPDATHSTADYRPASGFPAFSVTPSNPVGCSAQTTIGITVNAAQSLPNGQPDCTLGYAQTASSGGNLLGIWDACAACTTTVNGFGIHWVFTGVTTFTPQIVGAGTNLGAWTQTANWLGAGHQQPISDHAGLGWASPPSSGAYELH